MSIIPYLAFLSTACGTNTLTIFSCTVSNNYYNGKHCRNLYFPLLPRGREDRG
jgi:hypothetical protein